LAACGLASSNRDQWKLMNGCNLPHWPEKFYGDRLDIITHYDTDRKKTRRNDHSVMQVMDNHFEKQFTC